MADDWRLTVRVSDEDAAADLVRRLHDLRLDEADQSLAGGRIAVSRDDDTVFLYADSGDVLRAAAPIVQRELGDGSGGLDLTRWHPIEQEWEAAEVPLPDTDAEREVEYDRLQQREEAEAQATGFADWEVRIELPGHDETVELADRLESQGIPVIRRHTFLLVGAASEEEAHELAARLAGEAPEGSRVEVEPSGQMVWEVMPANPFAVFGGLGI
jgi:hypothetical protein